MIASLTARLCLVCGLAFGATTANGGGERWTTASSVNYFRGSWRALHDKGENSYVIEIARCAAPLRAGP